MKNIDKNTCWYDKNVCESMIRGAKGEIEGWQKLEKTPHFKYLQEALLICKSKGKSKILDLGCGSAEVGRVFDDFEYTGADMENIINGVAKKINPNFKYEIFDAYQTDYSIFLNHNIILMNALLDVLQEPLFLLTNIVSNTKELIAIHRQKITNNSTSYTKYPAYSGISYQSNINREEFESIINNHKYKICKELYLKEYDSYTFVLEKQ